MKKSHWSLFFFDFLTIEITYDDSARQTWDYEMAQFDTKSDFMKNMAADFRDPRMDRSTVFIQVTKAGSTHTGEFELDDSVGDEFVAFILEKLETIE